MNNIKNKLNSKKKNWFFKPMSNAHKISESHFEKKKSNMTGHYMLQPM